MASELRGRVIRGEGVGRTIGFPTANLDRRYFRHHPIRSGVYFAHAIVGSRTYPALAIIGVPSRREPRRKKIELYCLGMTNTIVGKYVRARVLKRLRDLEKFKTDRALVSRIKRDVAAARKYFDRNAV